MDRNRWSSTGTRRARSVLRAPAVQALLIQCAAFLLTSLCAYGVRPLIELPAAALLQGVLAAAMSRWRGLAVWWLFIQFFFPLALFGMQMLPVPPALYLAAFVLLLGLYWSTFRTQVPFYPSRRATWDAVAALLPQDRAIRFVDIGSGLGGLIMHLAERRPDSDFTGIELAPLVWLVSLLRAHISRNRGHFIRGDYEHLNFAQYDVVFAYLSPAAMPALWEKARAQMRPGALLLSYEFAIPDAPPHSAAMPAPNSPLLYGWRM